MKMTPMSLVLARTPAFSVDASFSDHWEELKDKILESSPTFYPLISSLSPEELGKADEKIQYTVWKYWNRAKYRATPFGSFAAFSLLPLKEECESPVLSENMQVHSFIDWPEKDTVLKKVEPSTEVVLNSSSYRMSQEVRFIVFMEGQFTLSSMEVFEELELILGWTKQKISLVDVCQKMQQQANLHPKSTLSLLIQLIDMQLLISDQQPNITGLDYFTRINHKKQSPISYTLSERRLIQGGVNSDSISAIPDLINFLNAHLPHSPSPSIEDFRNQFLAKFEQQEVPLSIALDPELGINYGNLIHASETGELISKLHALIQPTESIESLSYTPFHAFLLQQMLAGGDIRIDHFKSSSQPLRPHLPNTLSCLFRPWKDQILITSLGGVTTNALLGRFTLANKKLAEFTREIAEAEAAANPGILFFDISYQAEKQVDNVNRRQSIYPHELPLLCWSASNHSLCLADILVSVKGQDIVLRDRNTRKRLVPRIPTAYNYNRSDLAAYRFLCDLQSADLRTQLSFSLKDFFPHLEYYPRVYFKNILLSPATWLYPGYTKKEELKEWLSQNGINNPFRAGHADQTLVFNLKKASDIDPFLHFVKQQKNSSFYITEALVETDSVHDEKAQSYLPEFLISFQHAMQIYMPIEQEIAERIWPLSDDQISLPEEEWLYVEWYLHPSRSNELLAQMHQHLIKPYKKVFDRWFFIRYTAQGPHLRLRFQIKDRIAQAHFRTTLSAFIKPYLQSGFVSNLLLKPYEREITRYGITHIEQVEACFQASSEHILGLLKKTKEELQLYANEVQTLRELTRLLLPSEEKEFIKSMTDAFQNEFQLNKDAFKAINSSYNLLKNYPIILPINNLHKQAVEKAFSAILDQAKLSKLLADLIHMHVNRLFSDHQRLHEAILYQFLWKKVLAEQASAVSQPEQKLQFENSH
jgi:thiopeptide-type bacteriocin biosynthesis protein